MTKETFKVELVSAEGEIEKILKSCDIQSMEITFTYKEDEKGRD
jgi:hypothetical protein